MVTRTAKVSLPPGDSTVNFTDLPQNLLQDSVRIMGRGAEGMRLGTIETRHVYLEEVGKEDVRKLQAELQQLQDEDAGLANERAVAGKQLEFYQSIQFHNAEVWSKEITTGRLTVDDWAKVVSFLENGQKESGARGLALDIKRRELKDRVDTLKKRLADMQSQGAKDRTAVTLEVSAPSGGELGLELSYVVQGPFWSPLYEARAFQDKGEVELTYLGQVSQSTVEDWKGVKLSLSTAKPAIGGSPPYMNPWYVGIIEPEPVRKAEPHERYKGMKIAGEGPAPAPSGLGMADAHAQVMKAHVQATGPSVLFTAPTSQDVPADGSSHKVTISVEKIKAEFEYYAVPALSPFVYLKGSAKNETGYPFLAGEISVFLGQDFIGKSNMPLTVPGSKIDLALGIDEGIKVKREVGRFDEDTGLISKGRKSTFKIKTQVESFKDKPYTITVQDQVPVSRQEEVRVKVEKPDPEFASIDAQGRVAWRLELAPNEKKEISLEFYVEYPKDKRIGGI